MPRRKEPRIPDAVLDQLLHLGLGKQLITEANDRKGFLLHGRGIGPHQFSAGLFGEAEYCFAGS